MKLQIRPEMVKEIAGQLDMGFKCFYNIKTCELEVIPDEVRLPGYDDEPWQESIDKVDQNPDDYLCFAGMDSSESFRLMENFINEIPVSRIQMRFEEVIQRKKPFQQFKYLLLDYPELRQQWFEFKEQGMIIFVQDQIDVLNFDPDSE